MYLNFKYSFLTLQSFLMFPLFGTAFVMDFSQSINLMIDAPQNV